MASLPGFGLMEGSGPLGKPELLRRMEGKWGPARDRLHHPASQDLQSSLPGVNELLKGVGFMGSLHVLVLP